jgi:glycosyltransferase involved in cell wall biosynthesis
MSGQLTIVMPVFNEAEGIEEFIEEIRSSFKKIKPTILAVDDCSTDSTWLILNKMQTNSADLILLKNENNLGHGQSSHRALRHGLSGKSNFIMSVDGDGQFLGDEMFNFYEQFYATNLNYAEGCRVSRNDPWFRKIISFVTRILVFTKSGRRAIDANTPCRIYKAETLHDLIENIESTSLVPNLRMSILARKEQFEIFYFSLTNIPRRAKSAQGSSWGSGKTVFPNRRLITFCRKAIMELI